MTGRSLWRDHGAALVKRGWRAIPILPGMKIPGTWDGNGWVYTRSYQHSGVPSAAMLKNYQSWPTCGIGIILGRQGDASGSVVVAVDVDVRVLAVANEIEKLARKLLGPAPRRVGRWPKRLLLYRCTEEIAWCATSGYRFPGDPPMNPVTKKKPSLHRVEFLAVRKQFVAYGRHECGRDYSWIDGSPATLVPGELALVTPDTLQYFLGVCDGILLKAGGVAELKAARGKSKTTTVKAKTTSGKDQRKDTWGDPNPALHAGLLALLKATRRVLRWRGDRADILCPFMADHPERGDTGTALMPGGGIACHHATCNGRTAGDFIAKLKELAAEDRQDGAAIYDAAAHPKQLEIARAEFEEIDDATLANLSGALRPAEIQSAHQRQVRRAARAHRAALAAQAAWERLVEAAEKGQAP